MSDTSAVAPGPWRVLAFPTGFFSDPGPLRVVGPENGGVRTRHNLLLVQTQIDQPSEIVLAAVCHDVLVFDEGRIRLRERIVAFDTEMLPNSLVYPA